MTLSSCEIEHVTTSYATCQALWIEMMLEELKVNEVMKIKLLVDNKSITNLANIPLRHRRNKHIEIKILF